jgi:hypothetical protein
LAIIISGNTTGTSPVGPGFQHLTWQAGSGLTLSGAGSGRVVVHAAAPVLSYWENPLAGPATSWAGTSNSISVQRIYIADSISATRADVLLNISGSSSGALSLRANIGLYTASGSTLNSASTTSMGLSFNSTSAISYTAVSGPRSWSIPLGTWAVTPGEYFLAVNFGWSTASSNTDFIRMYGAGAAAGAASGGATGAFANATDYFRTGAINANAQSTLPATMQLSGMTQTGASPAQQPWVAFHGTF